MSYLRPLPKTWRTWKKKGAGPTGSNPSLLDFLVAEARNDFCANLIEGFFFLLLLLLTCHWNHPMDTAISIQRPPPLSGTLWNLTGPCVQEVLGHILPSFSIGIPPLYTVFPSHLLHSASPHPCDYQGPQLMARVSIIYRPEGAPRCIFSAIPPPRPLWTILNTAVLPCQGLPGSSKPNFHELQRSFVEV